MAQIFRGRVEAWRHCWFTSRFAALAMEPATCRPDPPIHLVSKVKVSIGSPAPGAPLAEVGPFGTKGRVVTVAGVHHCVVVVSTEDLGLKVSHE